MIKDMLENKRTVSFEIFPPKKDGEFKAVFEVLDALGRLSPDFVSVTYAPEKPLKSHPIFRTLWASTP